MAAVNFFIRSKNKQKTSRLYIIWINILKISQTTKATILRVHKNVNRFTFEWKKQRNSSKQSTHIHIKRAKQKERQQNNQKKSIILKNWTQHALVSFSASLLQHHQAVDLDDLKLYALHTQFNIQITRKWQTHT